MHARSYLLLATTLVGTAKGHGSLTVPTTRRGNTGYENDPVKFDTEAWVCRHAMKNPDVPLYPAMAGQITQLTWHFSAAHVGDCAVFLSYDVDKPLDSMAESAHVATPLRPNPGCLPSVKYSPTFEQPGSLSSSTSRSPTSQSAGTRTISPSMSACPSGFRAERPSCAGTGTATSRKRRSGGATVPAPPP